FSQEAEGGVDDLAMGSQPQTILTRPGGTLRVVVGRHAQDGSAIGLLPVALPAGGVKASVSQVGTRLRQTNGLKSANMARWGRQAAGASPMGVTRWSAPADSSTTRAQHSGQRPTCGNDGMPNEPTRADARSG